MSQLGRFMERKLSFQFVRPGKLVKMLNINLKKILYFIC